MSAIRQHALILALLATAACATSSSRSAASSVARWSGDFKQSNYVGTGAMSPTTPRRAGYGSITLTPVADDSGRTRIDLSISAPVAPGTQLAWAVFTGPCGAPTPPVTAGNEFPLIEVSNSGAGVVRTEMSVAFDPRTEYHANIYYGSRVTDVSNVLMCANLAYGGRR